MTSANLVNQMVIATVAGDQAGELTQHLTEDGFYFTQVDSRGGLLEEPTICLLIGLNHARLERLLTHLRECCHARRRFIPVQVEAAPLQIQPSMIEAEVGGAIIYVLNVERFEQL
jgi:uncharacterized protein YaaQ